jgi:hypothetical protein
VIEHLARHQALEEGPVLVVQVVALVVLEEQPELPGDGRLRVDDVDHEPVVEQLVEAQRHVRERRRRDEAGVDGDERPELLRQRRERRREDQRLVPRGCDQRARVRQLVHRGGEHAEVLELVDVAAAGRLPRVVAVGRVEEPEELAGHGGTSLLDDVRLGRSG